MGPAAAPSPGEVSGSVNLELITAAHGPEVRKTALDPEGRRRLRQEAAHLDAVDHPGIARLRSLQDDGAATVLTIEWAGAATVGTIGALGDEVVVVLGALLAEALAALHHAGLAHGRVSQDHVVVGTGRPVLCGLGDATPATEASRRRDVADLALLLDGLRVTAPSRRGTRSRVLDDVLRRAQRGGTDAPSAARLARALAALDGRSGGPGPGRPAPAAAPRRHPIPLRRAAAVAVVVAALLALVSAQDRRYEGGAPRRRLDVPLATSSGSGRLPPNPPPRCPRHPTPRADTDGDGCPGPITPTIDGLEADGRRYRLGRSGDRLAVGDWDCDGNATPALLRPSTGEVLVFDAWPEARSPTVRARTTRAPGARDLRIGPGACPTLVAVLPGDRSHPIPGADL